MQNYIKPGETLTFTAPVGGVVSGNAYMIGALLVVAAYTAAAGERFEGTRVGCFTLPKAAGTAWTEGQLLYWDTANSNLVTAQSATARRVGCAASAALSAATTGEVMLVGVPSVVNVA